MKTDKLTVASWNIAGGRKMNSLEQFDYDEEEDLGYFASHLSREDPDIILLKETHTNDERSLAAELGEMLDFPHVYDQPMSPSHIDPRYKLGMAVLSKAALHPVETATLPYPAFPLFFRDGRPVDVRHDKGVQLFEGDGLMIANTQMLPLGLFGKDYGEDAEGRGFANQIEGVLLDVLRQPIIFGGDFNYDQPARIYPHVYKQLGLHEALPDELTRPNAENIKRTPDHILYSNGVTLVESAVREVQADHYLCVATFVRD